MQIVDSVLIKTACWVDSHLCWLGIVGKLSGLIAVKCTWVTTALEHIVILLEVRGHAGFLELWNFMIMELVETLYLSLVSLVYR